jgi:hypothetical protein
MWPDRVRPSDAACRSMRSFQPIGTVTEILFVFRFFISHVNINEYDLKVLWLKSCLNITQAKSGAR